MHGPAFAAVLAVAIALLVGAGTRMVAEKVRLPYTIALLLLGLGTGVLLNMLGMDAGHAAHGGHEAAEQAAHHVSILEMVMGALRKVGELPPEVIIFVFLPALIFESAYAIDLHTFRKTVGPAVILAVPGLLVITFLTGGLMYLLADWAGWGWSMMAALTFGALISATDPVAVVALLRELGVDKKLAILIEGESLLNDGTAIVIFNVFVALLAGSEFQAGATAVEFLRVVTGGLVVGLVLARLGGFWMGRVFNDSVTEITLTIVVGYGCMLIAEGMLHVSGVMAIVAAGLWLGGPGRTTLSPEVEHFLHQFWEMLAYLVNTMVFFMVGIVIGGRIQAAGFEDFVVIVAGYLGIMAIRFVIVLLSRPTFGLVGEAVSPQVGIIAAWGGMRGAVSMALALILLQNEAVPQPIRDKILIVAAGIVFLSILVNGMTMKPVLARFGYDKPKASDVLATLPPRRAVLHTVRRKIDEVRASRRLSAVKWSAVDSDLASREHELELEIDEARTGIEKDSGSGKASQAEQAVWQQALAIERAAYWKSFGAGTLSGDAVRILDDEINVQLDQIHAGNTSPPARRMPDNAHLSKRGISQVFSGGAHADEALVYDLCSAEQQAARMVIAEVQSLPDADKAVVDRVVGAYQTYLRESTREIEEMRLHAPEVVAGIETRIARRLALNLERDGYSKAAKTGALDYSTAGNLKADVEARMQRLAREALEVALPEVDELLGEVPLFAPLSKADLKTLASKAQLVDVSAGEALFRQGDTGESLYAIVRGAAHVLREAEGEEHFVDVLSSGDILGEMALLTGEVRSATIKAATALALVRIDKDAFSGQLDSNPELAREIWNAFAVRRFDNTIRELPAFRHLHRPQRMAWVSERPHVEIAEGELAELPAGSAFAFVLYGKVSVGDDSLVHAPGTLVALEGATSLRAATATRVVALPDVEVVEKMREGTTPHFAARRAAAAA